MTKTRKTPHPIGLSAMILAAPIQIVAAIIHRTIRAIYRTVRRIRARTKDIALWSLTSVTALATAGGLMILGGCAPELQRTHHVRIDDNGNLATMTCYGECLTLEFEQIMPASTQ